MKQFVFVFATLIATSLPALADDYAMPKDAEAMVARGAKELHADPAGTISEINASNKKWIDRDLYLTVADLNGTLLAHPITPKLAGKNFLSIADADGKAFVKERSELAKTKGKFWSDYKYTDPITKKVMPKSAYCERVGEMTACAGIYKR